MHEGLCFTLADVIKPAYWALVHSARPPRALREGASAKPSHLYQAHLLVGQPPGNLGPVFRLSSFP
jgi:hypothetical protein